jgi:type 1 fimbria pilin
MIEQIQPDRCTKPFSCAGQFLKVGRNLLIFLIFALTSSLSSAGTITFPTVYPTIPDLILNPNISTISRDAAVGTLLARALQNVGVKATDITCSIQKDVTVNGVPVPGDSKTFQTNVPGVGVRFYITAGWAGNFVQAPVSETLSGNVGAQHYTQAELVVTGPLGSGTLTTLPSMQIVFSGSCVSTVNQTQYIKPGSIISARTCSVTTQSVAVALQKVDAKNLPNIGSTAGNTAFNVGVNCAAGTNVYMTMTDASSPSNRSSNLSLSSDSTARGAALQILRGQTLVSYGPDSAVAGTQNQWNVGKATGGVLNIPLSARYIRTGDTLTGGTVKGSTTFTMSYQ